MPPPLILVRARFLACTETAQNLLHLAGGGKGGQKTPPAPGPSLPSGGIASMQFETERGRLTATHKTHNFDVFRRLKKGAAKPPQTRAVVGFHAKCTTLRGEGACGGGSFAPLLNQKKRPFKPSNFIQGESPGEPPNPAPGGGPLPLRNLCSAPAPPAYPKPGEGEQARRISQGNKPGKQAWSKCKVKC